MCCAYGTTIPNLGTTKSIEIGKNLGVETRHAASGNAEGKIAGLSEPVEVQKEQTPQELCGVAGIAVGIG
jgi:hypothetical protein